ncbi:MAG: right-handed parallel beta-helix repeat-containing protein [Candidatus Kapabacteria bacterium]|nr:right-handed parallel beta-helix repeat-containing protein [Candidatus Kapabacteria bacterium]
MKISTKLSVLFVAMLFSVAAYGQVTIGSTNYSNLYSAFNAINAGTHTGDIVVKITGNITESTTAILQGSGVGSADYTSIVIYPTDTYKIQGTLSNGLIQLQGADNVTIDGRVDLSGTTRALTLKNNYTSTSQVIRIDSLTSGDAANYNTIRYCNIEAGTKTSSAYGITFGMSNSYSGSATSTGNVIEYNSFKKMYYAVRAYSQSGREVLGLKIHDNIFGSSTLTESIAYQPLYLYYTNGAEIYNNIFEYLDHTSTMYVMYIYYSKNGKIYNNTIRNINHVSTLYTIYMQQSSYMEVYGNVFDNLKSTGQVAAIYMGSCSYADIHDNVINNINSGSTFYGIYLTSSSYSKANNNVITNALNPTTFYAMYFSSNSYMEVKGNKFDNLMTTNGQLSSIYLSSCSYSDISDNTMNNTVATTYNYNVYATSCTSSKFHRNKINNISSNGSSTTGAHGFYIMSSNGSEFVNNSISNIRTTQYTTSTLYNPFGIFLYSGTGYKVYYNSIYLTGKQIEINSSSSMSACLMVYNSSVNNLDIRNNNFFNELEGRPGTSSYAIYMTSTSCLTNSTMDYNNYYVAGPYGIFGYISGQRYDLNAWKSATSREANSNNLFPDFNSSSVLAPFIGSPIFGKGTPLSGYTTDIIGDTRSTTAPTPGAYEVADDIIGPDVVFTKLQATGSTSNRTVVTTIKDRTGINLSTSEPRIYFRKTTTDNTYNGNTSSTPGWKYSTATQNGDEFTFVIDYSKINGGATTGDFIEYFIIVQDVSTRQNITVTSGTFNQFPTTTNLTSSHFPVTNADMYKMAVAITGDYSVGSSQTFTSLTKPDGFFQHLNDNLVTGDVFVNVTSNLSETGEVTLGKLVYEGGPYTVTIRAGSTTKRTIVGEIAGALIRIVGASNITIDGSYNGGGRYLQFNNSATQATSTYRATIMVGSGGTAVGGGKDITIKNCEILSGDRLSYSFGIITSDGAISTSASSYGITNLLIQNNKIYSSYYGMYLSGGSGTGQMLNNLIVEDNIVGDDTKSNSINAYGIEVRYAPNGQIRHNTIYNIDGTSSSTYYCIAIQLYMTGSIPTYIDGNTIYSINYQGTSACYSNGIYVSGSYAVITNNKISEILTRAYSFSSPTSYQAAGIRLAGSYTKVWHNTIYMTGEMKYYSTSTYYGGFAANIMVTSSYSGNDFRGNILHNSVYKASSSIYNPEAYNIWFRTSANIAPYFTALDNNVYSVGNTAKVGGNGLSYPYTFYAYNLAQWQSRTGKDQNSKTGLPEFVGANDLHINAGSIGNSFYMYNGMYEVTNDGDGEMRNTPTYYGADEINAIFELVEDTKIAPNQAFQCVGGAATVSFDPAITGFGDGVDRTGLPALTMQWFRNGEIIAGANTKNLNFNPVQMYDSARYYASAAFMNNTIYSTEKLMSVETPLSFEMQPVNTEICGSNPELYLPTVPFGTLFGYQWEFRQEGTSTWNMLPGEISPALYRTITLDRVGYYRLKVTGPGNCGPAVIYSDEAYVSLSDPLANVAIHQVGSSEGRDLRYLCVSQPLDLNTTVDGTVFGYRWQRDAGNGFIDLPPAQYPSALTATFHIDNTNPLESGIYRAKILGSAACGTAVAYTEPIAVRIWPYFFLDQQPDSKTLCVGESSFIRINTSGYVHSYQWFKDGVMLTAKETPNYNQPVLYFNNAQFEDAGFYQCRVQAEDCFGFLDFMSEEASVYVVTGTDITQNPFTQAIMVGGDVQMRVTAHVNGTPENYKPDVQWYRGDVPMVDGGRFIGTKSDRLMIHNVQESDFGEDYRVVVTGHCGFAEASNFGLLKGEIIITEQPESIDGCQDDEITLSVRANTTMPGEYLTYQWYKNGQILNDGNGITGSTENNLVISQAKSSHSGNYYAIVKTSNSVIGLSTVEATVRIEAKPIITVEPEENVMLTVGDVLALTVEAVGDNLMYQWYFEGTPIADEDLNTLMIYDVTESNSGKYYVEISNSCGLVKSVVSNVIVTTTASDVIEVAESGYSLGIATPNPAQTVSGVSYVTPAQSHVKITLINELGAEAAVLTDAIMNAGQHNLNINVEKLNLTSGIYSIVMKSSGVMISQRLVVIR